MAQLTGFRVQNRASSERVKRNTSSTQPSVWPKEIGGGDSCGCVTTRYVSFFKTSPRAIRFILLGKTVVLITIYWLVTYLL